MTMAKKETAYNKDFRKDTLGKRIKDFLHENRMTQTEFARLIDAELGLSDDMDYVPNAKKVSNWVRGEVYPDVPYLIAIATVMQTTVDSLLIDYHVTTSKTSGLSDGARDVLSTLLCDASSDGEGAFATVYFPYAYKWDLLPTPTKPLSRGEAIEFYERIATREYIAAEIQRLASEIAEISEDGITEKELEEIANVFPKYCTPSFFASEGNEKTVYFNNSDECYRKLQKIWEKYGRNDVYNAIFYTELSDGYASGGKNSFAKEKSRDAFYKSEGAVKALYNEKYGELVREGVISAERICEETKEHACELCSITDVDEDGDACGYYTVEFMCYTFRINLSNTEMRDFLKEEVNRKYTTA